MPVHFDAHLSSGRHSPGVVILRSRTIPDCIDGAPRSLLTQVCPGNGTTGSTTPIKQPIWQASPYDNPLIGRYAGRAMAERWGPQRKFGTWRRLWLALAEAEPELGLLADDGKSPRIRPSSSPNCGPTSTTSTSPRPPTTRRRLRHDVMAHVHTLGDVAPAARDIIHLGATSCYVTDNTDLILMRESLGDGPRQAASA